MAPRGRALVEAAKADGSWTRLDAPLSLEVPADLAEALAAHPPARGNFDAFPPSSRRIILEWIGQTKNPETRAARIRETTEQARENVRAHHWRQPGPQA